MKELEGKTYARECETANTIGSDVCAHANTIADRGCCVSDGNSIHQRHNRGRVHDPVRGHDPGRRRGDTKSAGWTSSVRGHDRDRCRAVTFVPCRRLASVCGLAVWWNSQRGFCASPASCRCTGPWPLGRHRCSQSKRNSSHANDQTRDTIKKVINYRDTTNVGVATIYLCIDHNLHSFNGSEPVKDLDDLVLRCVDIQSEHSQTTTFGRIFLFII